MIAIHRPHVIRVACAGALTLAASAWPAFAHHAMGGKLPQSLMQGFLSGVGHPIIGLDHLAFIIAVGLSAALAGRLLPLSLAFVAGTLAGCLIHLGSVTLPIAEVVIAASVLLLGAIIAFNRRLPPLVLAVLFLGVGLFHGWAYGESIFGAEQTLLVAYLAGFMLVQLAIAVLAGTVGRRLVAEHGSAQTNVRLAGAVVAGVGLAIFVGHFEGFLFPGVH